jgi:hypothetical protein
MLVVRRAARVRRPAENAEIAFRLKLETTRAAAPASFASAAFPSIPIAA